MGDVPVLVTREEEEAEDDKADDDQVDDAPAEPPKKKQKREDFDEGTVFETSAGRCGNQTDPQAIGTAILYSFYQKRKKHRSGLVPCILMSPKSFIVFLYDCLHDVLLQSDEYLLFSKDGELEFTSVLFLWFVLSGNFSSPERYEPYLSSNFHKFSYSIDIYNNEVDFGSTVMMNPPVDVESTRINALDPKENFYYYQ